MARSRRGRKTKKAVRHRGVFTRALARQTATRRLLIDPLESRVLLAADMNVRYEVDAPGPVSSLSVGENFTLKVFVQDARPTPQGVLQAYYNFAYSTSVAAVTGPVVNGADFLTTASGDDSTPGQIKAAGGLSTTLTPPTPGSLEQLLFSVPMKIVGAGQFNLTPSLATSVNPSDTVLLYGSSSEPLSAMNFTGLPLTIASGPAVSSITTADNTPTNASQVHYTVTFNEPVSGVDASDFSLIQTGITGSGIVTVSPSSGFNTVYTVTVNAGNLTASTGALGLNLVDGDVITDGASNTLAGGHTFSTIFTGPIYTIDRTAPTVSSIALVGSSSTHAASAQYTVTFSKSVTGVATSDFSLAASGVTGAVINSLSGSGTTYTVTVNTGSGDGTLGLNLIDGPAKISDAAGNTLAGGGSSGTLFTGQVYTIRKTPPAATAITPASANPTNSASAQFAVTFNEAVSGVAAADFALVPGGGISGASITSVTGGGANWTVTVNTGTGSGTLGLNLINGTAAISDAAGNVIAGAGTNAVLFSGAPAYTIDKTPIAVSSITQVETSTTNRASVDFTVTFNKSVSGVTAADFTLPASGVAGAVISTVSGTGATWTVTASTGTGNGTLGLNLINGPATISDAAGNTLAGGGTLAILTTGPVYTIDKTPISVSSIALAQAGTTNQGSVAFTVTFNKSVSGVTPADFSPVLNGISGAVVSGVTGGGTTYTVTVSTGTGNGTLGLNLVDGAATISDAAGNTLAGHSTGGVLFAGPSGYTIDKTPISVSSIALVQSATTNRNSVAYTVTFNKSVTGLLSADFATAMVGISGAAVTSVTGSGTTYTVNVSTGTGNGTLGLNLVDGTATISDAAGNTLAGDGSGAVISSGPIYTIDKTPLAVSSIALVESSLTNRASVDFTVTFNKSASGVTAADFSLPASGVTGAAISTVSGNGATWTITVNTGSGNGTLGLNLIDGPATISDAAGNTLAGGGTLAILSTGPLYTIDKTPISVNSIALVESSPTNRASVDFTLVFNKTVTGLTQADFTLAANGLTGASITNLTGSGTTYTVTASTGSGSGTLGLNVVDGPAVVHDAAGNTFAGGGSGATLASTVTPYTIDKTPPVVSSIALADASPTRAAVVHFTVTFSKPVTNVVAGDFATSGTGIVGAGVTNVSGGGATWTVTAGTGTGDGTLGLNLIDGATPISDAVGNTLGGGGTSNILFTGQTLYTVVKSPPAVSSIALVGGATTNAAGVSFTVTFDRAVSGVASADFSAVAGSGISGAAVSGVSGGGTTWTVTVNTGSGDGTLGLNLIDGSAAISDAAGNTLAGDGTLAILSTGPAYTIDKTPISVSSIALVESSPTNRASVDFTVTFNKVVTGLTEADFALAASGPAGASITNLAGGGAIYTVTANTGSGDGTLGLKLIDGLAVIQDAAGNRLAGDGSGATLFSTATPYTIDKTPPTVSSITLADANPTRAASVAFTVTFSEPVSGVAAGDFATSGSGLTGASVASVSGSGATWTVTVSTGTGDGTLGLNLIDGATPISDAAGNTLGGDGTSNILFTGPTLYTIVKSPPAVSSIALVGGATTNAATVSFTVTFNRAVTGVASGDFSPVAGGGVTGAVVAGVSGGGATWTVTVNTGSGDGTLGLNLVDGSAAISDAAGNTLAGDGTGAVLFAGTAAYTIDKTPPKVTAIDASDVTPTAAAIVHFTVTFSESVTAVAAGDFNLVQSGVTGAAISGVTGGGATWTVTATTGTGNGTLGLNLVDGATAISDAAGNTLGGGNSGATIFTGELYTLDRTLPTVISVLPAGTSPTNQASVAFTVVFSESVTGVDITDFAAVAAGIAGAQVTGVSGSGTTYSVTLGTGTGSGTLGLNVVDGNVITDETGKTLAGGHTGKLIFAGATPYTIDKTPIEVSSIALVESSPTNHALVHFTVTFNKSVAGVAASDFALVPNGISGAAITNVTGNGTTWTVTANTGSGNGTLGLNLIDGAIQISDIAGNTLAGGGSDDVLFQGTSTYTIDKSPVAISSIALANTSPTNLTSVSFTVTFNKSVTSVAAADFALATGVGISGAAITNVTGSGTTWTVTANTGSGNGTLGLNLVDGSVAITDTAGNTLAGGNTDAVLFTGTPLYTIDKTAPTVSSIAPVGNSPTNAVTVQFTVTFSESVSNVAAADFALATGVGINGAAITSVTGNGTTWTVTANTGTGSGTLGLNLVDGSVAITDAAGNTLAGDNTGAVLFTGTPLYTIDKTAPTVSSIAPVGNSPTNAATVQFTVTFSESVTGVAAADFALATGAGISGAAITNVTGNGTTWTVTANTGSGSGTLGLNLVDGSVAITDAAGNTQAGGNTDAVLFTGTPLYTIDKTAPTVSSIALVGNSPTNAATVQFTVTFSESVSNVAAADFALATGAGISGAAITNLTGSGTTWTVTANTGSGSGTLGLNLVDGSVAITDAAGNTLAGDNTGAVLFTGTLLYTIDKTAPTVSSIALAGTSPTNAATVQFTVTFSESVTGVADADFALATGVGISGAAITNVTGNGTTWTVTANTGTGNGTLGLNIVDGSVAITDAAGNTLAGGGTGHLLFTGTPLYTIDKTAPTVSSIALAGNSPTNAATVQFTVTFGESVTNVGTADFALATGAGISGAAITNVTGNGTTWTVTANTGTGSGTLGLNLIDGSVAIIDTAGNALAGGNTDAVLFTGTPLYTIDKTAPTVSSIAPVGNSPTNAATVQFTVTFGESVTNVAAADFALATGAGISGAAITNVTGSGTTWTVTANTGNGNGTLGLNLVDGSAAIADAAGNTLAGGGTGHLLFTGTPLYAIDKTAPTVVSIAPAGGNPTNGATAQFTVTFSKSVSGVDSSDFALGTGGGVTGAGISGVTGNGTTWTVTVNTGSGNGSINLNLIDGDAITDAAGNTLAGGHTGATIFTSQTGTTIQKTPPSVQAIALADANPVSGPATVHFTVTFSEPVTGLNASDFALTASGLAGSAITGVTGSGATWTVTATSGSGAGTLGLKLIDGDAITDAAGNTLAGGHTGNTIFSSPTSYSVQTAAVQSISVVGLGVIVTQGTAVTNAELATFTAVGGSQSAGGFTATIDWGDGGTSTGTVAATANGFSVSGSHSYASPGDRPVKITVQSGGVSQLGLTNATVGSPNELFVAQVYRDLLNREPEPQGLEFWTNLINGGMSRQTAVGQIDTSPEFRDYVVQGLFQLYLHRTAEPAAVSYFSDFLAHGTSEQMAIALAASNEYFQVRGDGTNTGFVTALYNDALNRNPDAFPLHATATLDLTKPANRAMIAQVVFGSDEYLDDLVSFPGGTTNPFRPHLPFGFFQAFLGRNADSATTNYYVVEFKQGDPDTEIVAQILASDEYFARAATQPG